MALPDLEYITIDWLRLTSPEYDNEKEEIRVIQRAFDRSDRKVKLCEVWPRLRCRRPDYTSLEGGPEDYGPY